MLFACPPSSRSRYPEKWRYTREQAVGKSLGGFFSKRSVDDWKMVYWTQWLVSAGILVRPDKRSFASTC